MKVGKVTEIKPLLKKDDYLEKQEELRGMRMLLRHEFVEQEVSGQPINMDRRIDGFEYKRLDNLLLAELEELERDWRRTKWTYALKFGHKHRESAAEEDLFGLKPQWKPISREQYLRNLSLRSDQGGKVVRVMGDSKNRWYEELA